MSRNFRSPIPRTSITCSTRRKGPCSERCVTIRSAIARPIPGSASNSSTEALLRLIRRTSIVEALAVELCNRSSGVRFTQPTVSKAIVITMGRIRFASDGFCFTCASWCLRRGCEVAAHVCTLLQVQSFQKLGMFYGELSTEFSTSCVEMFRTGGE